MNKEEISKRIDEGLKILKQEPSFIFNLKEIEAIQYLQNEIIDIQKDINFHLDKENIISKEELKAKQTILNLISKLQKENKELKEENVKLKMQLEVEKIDNKYNKEEASEEMMPRYVVWNKIKELEEMELNNNDNFMKMRNYAVLILKEIVKE